VRELVLKIAARAIDFGSYQADIVRDQKSNEEKQAQRNALQREQQLKEHLIQVE
jgi:hypothetical protein